MVPTYLARIPIMVGGFLILYCRKSSELEAQTAAEIPVSGYKDHVAS
jgi:hypothetical protein